MTPVVLPKHIPLYKTNTFLHDFYGDTVIDIKDMHLHFARGYGLCANFFVLMWELIDLKAHNLVPTSITSQLQMYQNYDWYSNAFTIDTKYLQEWKEIDSKEIYQLRSSMAKSTYGLGQNKNNILQYKKYFDLIFKAYFNFNLTVLNRVDYIVKNQNIDINNTRFIWWRKGNKPTEVNDYPGYANVKEHVNDDLTNILQTDDKSVLEEFSQLKNIKLLDVLPVFETSTNIDIEVQHNSPQQYQEKYNKDYFNNILDIFVLIIIASKCKKFIGYPGQISQAICMLRGDFEKDSFFFKNNREIF